MSYEVTYCASIRGCQKEAALKSCLGCRWTFCADDCYDYHLCPKTSSENCQHDCGTRGRPDKMKWCGDCADFICASCEAKERCPRLYPDPTSCVPVKRIVPPSGVIRSTPAPKKEHPNAVPESFSLMNSRVPFTKEAFLELPDRPIFKNPFRQPNIVRRSNSRRRIWRQRVWRKI